MFAMKLLAMMSALCTGFAASWSDLFSRSAQIAVSNGAASKEDIITCENHTKPYITQPMVKSMAIEKAVDNCALDKKVDDKNFVCPHFKEVLTNAFARESLDKQFTAGSFCELAENYVFSLKHGAANIPHVAGSGKGKDFEVSKDCEAIIAKSLLPETALPSKHAPDFWYAMCMNQDCAHFLPSRTRWCNQDRQPMHSAAVCESIRTFTRDEVVVVGDKRLTPKDVCKMYDEYVEDSHVNVDAYMHVVHAKKEHAVPSPENPERALNSASMKYEAEEHQIRDSTEGSVKGAAASTSLLLSAIGCLSFFLREV